MAKRKDILTAEDFERAWRIYNGEGFYYIDDEENPEIQLCSKTIDPESALLKKESIQSLSDEAKEVIEMLISAPSETIRALSSPTGLLTKRSIRIGLQRIWHSKFIAKTVIEELTRWANQL